MQVAFERIHRKTEPIGPGNRDGIQEVFEVIKVPAEYPVRLGNRTYRSGGCDGCFSKTDAYGWVRTRTYWVSCVSPNLFKPFLQKRSSLY